MPNTREKLIELLKQTNTELRKQLGAKVWGDFADHLIANGVTIPVPCEHCKRHTKCLIEEQLHFVKAEERYCCAGERKDNDG